MLSTGAIVEALECLTTAVVNCRKTKDAFLTLTGTVAPTSVNLEQPPANDALTYKVDVTNADATKNASAFEIDVTLPANVPFTSATLTVDGADQPNPPGAPGSVKVPLSSLDAGKSVQLSVTATFDPAQIHAGDAVTATASIVNYTGPHAADVPMITTFTDIKVDGPRVVFNVLPTALTSSELGALLRKGVAIPFTEPMDPNSASVDPTTGDVFLEIFDGTNVSELPIGMTWSNGNQLLTLNYADIGSSVDPIALLVQQIEANPTVATSLRIRLLGGLPKGTSSSPGPALSAADGMRLDGDPPQGGPPDQRSNESGNGEQGGDFIWPIPIKGAPAGPADRRASR